jgi:hypothetical protein
MGQDKVMYPCFMCAQRFQMSDHEYDGRFIASYRIVVCQSCWDSNWEGWASHHEQRLVAHLDALGLPIPKHNAKGWLPRE